jgi:hypothetical protein
MNNIGHETPHEQHRSLAIRVSMAIATIVVIVLAIGIANTTLTTQTATASQDSTSTTDPTGLAQDFVSQVQAFLSDGQVNDDSSVTIAAALIAATGAASTNEIRESVHEINIPQVEVGTGEWRDGALPGEIVTIEIPTVNRRQGKYGHVCLQQAALTDVEFKMLRHVRTLECDRSGEKLAEWRSEAQFSINHRRSEVGAGHTDAVAPAG